MKLSATTWAVLATAAAATAGVAVYAYRKTRPSSQAPQGPLGTWPSPAPQGVADEPPEGYEARWEAMADVALATCQADDEVESFAQAVTCALNAAYPEAAPWTDPVVWSPWMEDAAALVQGELLRITSRDGGSPQSWEIVLWLRGPTELDACRRGHRSVLPRVMALCAARRIFPSVRWDEERQPWQREFLAALVELERQERGT